MTNWKLTLPGCVMVDSFLFSSQALFPQSRPSPTSCKPETLPILVNFGCYNKISQGGCFKQQTFMFRSSGSCKVPRSKVWILDFSSIKNFPPGLLTAFFLGVHMAFFVFLFFFFLFPILRTLNLSWSPTLMTSSKSKYLPKTSLQILSL